MLKKIVIGVLVLLALAFAGIQFVPVERSNPPVTADLDAPAPVKDILHAACYDCHSNETRWPWYSHVAPVSWLLAGHVKGGRSHLNFSEWGSIDASVQGHIKAEIVEEVSAGNMPLPPYLRMHPEARLSPTQIETLRQWAAGAAESH